MKESVHVYLSFLKTINKPRGILPDSFEFLHCPESVSIYLMSSRVRVNSRNTITNNTVRDCFSCWEIIEISLTRVLIWKLFFTLCSFYKMKTKMCICYGIYRVKSLMWYMNNEPFKRYIIAKIDIYTWLVFELRWHLSFTLQH